MKKILLIFCCVFMSLLANAQAIQSITNIKIQQQENQIIINYDIEDDNNRNVYVINVKVFDSASFEIKVPKVVTGDVGTNITVGKNKTVRIPITENALSKTGKYGVSFFDITKYGINEKNAVARSLMVPGWGDRYVFENGKTKGYLITAISYGCIGYGIYSKLGANKEYKNYQSAYEQKDIDSYYDNTIKKNNQFILFTSIGVGVWVCDVVRVSMKYKSNQKLLSEKGITKAKMRDRINYCITPPLNKYQPSMLYFSYKF